MSWLGDLEVELARVGIRGRAARRIEAELADHLVCDPASETRLGAPREVAERFAAELGIVRTRHAAYGSFVALTLAALGLFATTAAYSAAGGWPDVPGWRATAVALSGVVILFAPQIAFAAGMLGIARTLRLRRRSPVPPAELRLVQRRMAVATAAAAVGCGCMLVHAWLMWSLMPPWWDAIAVGAAVVPLLALLVAIAAVRGARAIVPDDGSRPAGIAADVPAVVAPYASAVIACPWRLAAILGAGVSALVLVATAHAESSLLEGLERGVAEAIVFTSCFVLLGRLLGIRR